jgi:hypothetical protein
VINARSSLCLERLHHEEGGRRHVGARLYDHASIVSRGGRAPLTLEEGIGGHKQRPYALLNNRRKS